MSTTSANKILVDLAIARESARVGAEDARTQRRLRAQRISAAYDVIAAAFPERDMRFLAPLSIKIVDAVDSAGSAGPER